MGKKEDLSDFERGMVLDARRAGLSISQTADVLGFSSDLNPIEHLWDVVEWEIRIMDVQLTNLQQLCDAIMSIWTKISEECFQHLVESMAWRIKAVLKKKGGPTRY